MHLDHPKTIPQFLVHEKKIVFHETGPCCQNDQGLLLKESFFFFFFKL